MERRRKYIQRQMELDKSAVDVAFAGRRPEGSGPRNRYGMPQLPVGQHVVKNWPVLDLGEQPEISLDKWKLEITGLVENPYTLNWEQFLAMRQVEDVSDFHCVTTWSRFDNRWGGVAFASIAEHAVPKPEAKFVLCTGYDFMRARTCRTRSTCLSCARSTRTSCSYTRGKASRCRASTAGRAA